ncbi:hypothetical protein CAP35_13965 [Chitinophagaceae bacterium IBVUCB1]|nr:hypothetical protein CAP35_13965 [Chitinophagaceae bacterium IBVUCB1]
MPASKEIVKINWRIVNALRGIAALGVVLNHARGWLFSNDILYAAHVHAKASWAWWEWLMMIAMQFTSLGAEFVIMFFLLSGFSIAHSISKSAGIAGFLKRRAIRLYPTYIIGLLWAFVAFNIARVAAPQLYYSSYNGEPSIATHYATFAQASNILLSLLYVFRHDYLTHQYWSLPLEVIFYILAPWLIKYMRVWMLLTVAGVLAGLWLTGIYFHEEDDYHSLWLFVCDYSIFFLLGVLMYQYREKLVSSFRIGKWPFYIISIVSFVLFVWVKGHLFHEVSNKVTAIISAAFTVWLLFGALKHQVIINWLDKLGHYSYTLYVTHLASIFCVKIMCYRLGYGFDNIDNLFVWLAGVVASVGVAYLLYLVAERPSILWLQKLRDKT